MSAPSKLTLGPVLYNWPAEKKRDFYFKIAEEAPIDVVYLGEVTCSKRTPFFAPFLVEICERLEAAGKEVILSSQALIMTNRERKELHELIKDTPYCIEANDLSAVSLLQGRDHIVGPFVNTYNEGTLDYFFNNGATRIVLPNELQERSIKALCACAHRRDLEIQAFGRLPLALSARCYHARSHKLTKDSCLYVCENDPDGMDITTLDGDPFLAVNGTQTMSFTIYNLLKEIPRLAGYGITHFRLWPHDVDMISVAHVYRNILEGNKNVDEAFAQLEKLVPFAPFSNGFFHGVEGVKYVE